MIWRPNQAICTHHVSVYGIASPITTPWTRKRKRIKGGRVQKTVFSVAALQEAGHEVAGQARTGIFLGAEVLHDVR